MKQKFNASFILALLMSFAIIGCNDPKKDDAKKTDAVKTETNSMPGYDPAMDPTKTAGYPATILGDTLGMKAYEFDAKPGDTIPMHSHPDHVIYVLEGGTGDITGNDGKTQSAEFKKGQCIISGPQAHSAIITGTTALKLLIVQVYRPRG
ncbi:MAG: cupin domain-containing protein [Bacteroidota bacterium]